MKPFFQGFPFGIKVWIQLSSSTFLVKRFYIISISLISKNLKNRSATYGKILCTNAMRFQVNTRVKLCRRSPDRWKIPT